MSHRLPLGDIQFISDFAAFCRTKGDETYDYLDARACAMGQFGYPGLFANGSDDADIQVVPYLAMDAAGWRPHTFSALAERLEALLVDAPEVKVSA